VEEILQILNAHNHKHEKEQGLVNVETTIMHHDGNHNQGLYQQTFAKVVEILIIDQYSQVFTCIYKRLKNM
jgi:hypothetical protein